MVSMGIARAASAALQAASFKSAYRQRSIFAQHKRLTRGPTTSDCIGTSQLVVELPVYPDQSPGWNYAEDPQGDSCPCEFNLSRWHTGLCSCSELPVLP